MKEIKILKRMSACNSAIEWLATQATYKQAWRDCPRGDWMLWLLYKKLDGSDAAHRKFTLAKARCAKTVFHLIKDERSRNAVLVAEKYGIGEASIEELRNAAAAADGAAAYAAADAYAAAAAYAAADAYAADAAAAYAGVAAYAADADAAAKKENQLLTANIVRELYPDPPKL